jgi:hypothetical protein
MPVAARAKAPDREMLSRSKNASSDERTNSTSNEAINQARSLKTGSRPKQRFVKLKRTASIKTEFITGALLVCLGTSRCILAGGNDPIAPEL